MVTPGVTPAQLVQTIGIVPTVLGMAGVADTAARQGTSLAPLLQGKAAPWRSSVLIEYYSDTVFPRMVTMGYQAVRTERYKYIHYTALSGMDERNFPGFRACRCDGRAHRALRARATGYEFTR